MIRLQPQSGTLITALLLVACTASTSNDAGVAAGGAGGDTSDAQSATGGNAGRTATDGGAGGDTSDAQSATGGTAGRTASDGGAGADSLCTAPTGCTYTVDTASLRATTTLDCFCAEDSAYGCPASADEAIATVLPKLMCLGGIDGYPFVDRGCGFVTVGYDGLWGVLWHYDEATGKLVGAERWGDLAEAPCPVAHFVGGDVPDCASMDRCTTCTTLNDPVPVCQPTP